MNIAQLSLVGFEDGKKSIEDGRELSSLFVDAVQKIRQGINDDAAAAGFDPHRPLRFNGAPDVTGHKLLAEMQALEARIDEEKNRHDWLIDATEEVWRKMSTYSARGKFRKRLPQQAIGDIMQLGMHLAKEIKDTGLLKDDGEALQKQGTTNVLMWLLHGYLASETVNGLRANIQARPVPGASQQTKTIPATQYEPALVKKIESLELEVSKKDAKIKSQRAFLSYRKMENTELTERSNAERDNAAKEISKLRRDYKQSWLDLQDKHKEIRKLNSILRSTTEKYSEAKRQLTEIEDTANPEVEDAIPESTQAAREMSDDLMSLITDATAKKAEVERRLSQAEEELKRKDASLESVQKTLDQRKSEIDIMRADIEQREKAVSDRDDEIMRLKEEVETWKSDARYYHSQTLEMEISAGLTETLHNEKVCDLERKLEEQTESHKQASETIREESRAKTETIETGHRLALEEAKAETENLQKKYDQTTERLEKEAETLRTEHQKATDLLQKEADTRIETLTERHQKALDEAQTKSWTDIEACKTEHRQSTDTLRCELNTKYDKAINEAQKTAQKEIDNLQTKHQDAADKLKAAEARIESLNVGHKKALEDSQAASQNEIEIIRAGHQEAIKKLQREADEKVTRLHADHKKALEDSQTASQNEIGVIRAGHQQAVEKLQREANDKVAKIHADHENALKNSRETAENQANDLRQSHDQALELAKTTAESRADGEIETMRNTHQASLERLRTDFKSEKEALVKNHEKATEKAKADAEGQIKALQTSHQSALNEAKNDAEATQKRLQEAITKAEENLGALRNEHQQAESEIESLRANHKEESDGLKSEIRSLDDALDEVRKSLSATETNLRQEKEQKAQVLQTTQVSYDNAVEAWAVFCFGRNIPEELKNVISNGTHTQIATQNHHAWVIEDTWTKTEPSNSAALDPDASFGEAFIKVVSMVLSGRLISNDFIFLMRRLTLLTSQAASVNTATLGWLVEECRRMLVTEPHAEIPSKTALWALSDVLTSRWPDMECHRQRSLIIEEAHAIIGSAAESPLRAYVLKLDDHQPDATVYVVKNPDWPVGIYIDTQRQMCSFIEPECTYGLFAKALLTGVTTMEIRGPSRSISVNFRGKHDRRFWSRDIW